MPAFIPGSKPCSHQFVSHSTMERIVATVATAKAATTPRYVGLTKQCEDVAIALKIVCYYLLNVVVDGSRDVGSVSQTHDRRRVGGTAT